MEEKERGLILQMLPLRGDVFHARIPLDSSGSLPGGVTLGSRVFVAKWHRPTYYAEVDIREAVQVTEEY